ncbi:response regulator [Gimesia aquarii]|uniref:histidine kinase n=1 Tax=Gimesia aquarii TaxID=2527964 RepID=A0A517VRE6_9PLAN|nr:response regulator [Gimesia aquarii]QDT95596.1 Autoinducer 2 sensor kinase/phosphatase LuxQ [Gimesia aquarii]
MTYNPYILTTNSTLADLELRDDSLTPEALGSEVERFFKSRPDTNGVLIRDDHQFYGLLSRTSCFENMTQSFCGTTFSRRPVKMLVEHLKTTSLQLNDTVPISEAVREILGRPSAGAYEPIIVKCENDEYRFLDITTLMSAQCDLQLRQKKIAEDANHEKSNFLANMSHEIRTPLNGILGFTDVLRRGVESKEKQQEYLDVIYKNGEHLLGLINDILDLSKIEAGCMEFEKLDCSPHKIISDVLSTMRVQAKPKGLYLECQWESGVPEMINTDPTRLRQILMNLVGNAVKFTTEGGVKLIAKLDISHNPPQFIVEVHDTGIGIKPENMSNIFSAFTQADSSITRSFGGTGLGLTICRQIAEGLGGDLAVESEIGQGSVFRLRVDAGTMEDVKIFDVPPTEALTAESYTKRNYEASNQLQSLRVLLVDDGKTNRDLVSLVLTNANAVVTCAENGEEALSEYEGGSFDLILMDMQMPEMDGYTATQILRSRGCSLPIIALTANAMRGDRSKCLEAGCSDFLTKPINIDSLLQTVGVYSPLSDAITKSQLEEKPYCLTTSDTIPVVSDLPTEIPQIFQIVEEFIQRFKLKIEEMQMALDKENWKLLEELAHWLKGTGGTAGFGCLTELAYQLESAAQQKEKESANLLISELRTMGSRLTTKNAVSSV